MHRIRLNLAALRRNRLPRVRQTGLIPNQLLASVEALSLSRRDVLGLAGVAVGIAPALKAFSGTFLGPVELVGDENRLAFRLSGRERWVIDTRRFSGVPKLKINRGDRYVRLELRNARYPGTDLSAGMVCELRRGAGGWRMRLSLALGGFQDTVPLERWLIGAEPARSRVNAHTQACKLGDSSAILIGGSAVGEFSPNWVLRLTGPRVARLFGFGGEMFSDSIAVSVLSSDDPSILNKPEPKRTLISLERGKHAWLLSPGLSAGKAGKLVPLDNMFDLINVEVGESQTGAPSRALVAESKGEEVRVAFQPGGDLIGDSGNPFRLPLRNVRYAVTFQPTGDQSALSADFAREPVWLHANGCSVQLGGSEGIKPFELIALRDQVKWLRCAPAVHRVVAPLPGAFVEPALPTEGMRLAFVSGPITPQAQIRTGQVRIDPKQRAALLRLLPPPISVVRPEDLLSLEFSFVNLSLETSGSGPRLVRSEAGKPAYVVVQFPPQNIAEQAFFEADSKYPVTVPPGKSDPDAGRKESDEIPARPVRSRLSGPSRLAFIVPDEMTETPYTLESLLDWSKYQQSVAATALPPPAPVVRGIERMQPGRAMPRPSGSVLERSPQTMQVRPQAMQRSTQAKPTDQKAKVGAIQPQLESSQLSVEVFRQDPSVLRSLADLLKIREPELYQTAIELPYRLTLSPNRFAGWAHSRIPVEHNGRTELWHTRLGVRASDGKVDERSEHYRTVRAIWSPDYSPEKAPLPDYNPFGERMSLTRKDRHEVVRLSSDFIGLTAPVGTQGTAMVVSKTYEPRAIQVSRLMLTSLGAWLDSRGTWEPPVPLTIEEWRHLATMGRDHYVRVVYKGYLFPFGHRASLVKVTERKFQRPDKGGPIAAYLRQRMFIIVREPEKEYPAVGQQNSGRKLPFRRVRITTLITPNLDKPKPILQAEQTGGPIEPSAFWPEVGPPFPFHLVAEDLSGQTSEFTVPLIFVKNDVAADFNPNNPQDPNRKLTEVFTEYTNQAANRAREMRGQSVTYAESSKAGDTTLETAVITFEAEPPEEQYSALNLLAQNQPPFYPVVEEAQVRLTSVEQMTGTAAPARIQFHTAYVEKGFDAGQNKGQVFAKLVEPVQVQFGGGSASTDKAGGFVSPSMAIGGLSRTLGAVGGVGDAIDKIVSGKFDPIDFFKGALGDAKILGGITLWDILEVINDFTGLLDRVPKFQPIRLPDALEASFTWNAAVKNGPDSANPILTFSSPQDAFTVDARLRTPLNGQPPTYEITASLRDFQVHLVPQVWEVIILKFRSLSFIAKNGQKPDVSVDFDSYEFLPPLNYIDQLLRSIPLDGFKDPPNLDITPQGVKLGYTLGVPAVTLGVMSLQNISVSAEFSLPFTGDPINFRFALCERHNPFLLTVWIFGGGGFFAIELEPTDEGLKRLEGSFEFGGNFALDIGVASGGVHVMAGIYFAVTSQKTQLTGYLRCGGSVDVLGIICISVEFYMELSYVSPPTRVWGRATLTVEIEILFFSISVDLTVEREFAGSGEGTAFVPVVGDYAPALPVGPALTVGDMMTAEDWTAYCEAFA